MDIKLKFLGAAGNVTGSNHLVEANGMRIMIDCGFYQEREFKHRNYEPFPVDAASIDYVILTHAHLDHCGLLPKLYKEGFRGQIVATEATADIAEIVMYDSAKIQKEDLAFKQRRHEREGRKGPYPYEPLFTPEDVTACLQRTVTAVYGEREALGSGISVEFFDAGHILGSASVRLSVTQAGETRTILFSGDIGRWNSPIICDPAPPAEADYILLESTYGSRKHKPNEEIPDRLADVINSTRKRGGNLIVPSFAIERTQELLYHLHELLAADRIPHLNVFVDSPMAVRVTEVFRRHSELFDAETMELLAKGQHPCDFPGLVMSSSVAQSKAINHISGTAIIIAGSGMCTGGRIKHHIAANIEREASTLMFVGYQARGTLGRILLERADTIRIHGQTKQVRAQITKINGFSAHAGQDELLRWAKKQAKAPRKLFVVHGEPEASAALEKAIQQKLGWETMVPAYGDEVTLD
jgi:metallo-beta-lactamase family protein